MLPGHLRLEARGLHQDDPLQTHSRASDLKMLDGNMELLSKQPSPLSVRLRGNSLCVVTFPETVRHLPDEAMIENLIDDDGPSFMVCHQVNITGREESPTACKSSRLADLDAFGTFPSQPACCRGLTWQFRVPALRDSYRLAPG
jgi:hypothetical protein